MGHPETHTDNPLDQRSVSNSFAVHDVTETVSDLSSVYGPVGVGAYLRQMRIKCDVSVNDMAKQILRIRPQQLQDLEDGALDKLPGLVYAIGYVRTYATFLGLDHQEIVNRFKVITDTEPDENPGVPDLPPRENRLPRPMIAIGLFGIAVVIYGGWSLFQSATPRVAMVPEPPSELNQSGSSESEPNNFKPGDSGPDTLQSDFKIGGSGISNPDMTVDTGLPADIPLVSAIDQTINQVTDQTGEALSLSSVSEIDGVLDTDPSGGIDPSVQMASGQTTDETRKQITEGSNGNPDPGPPASTDLATIPPPSTQVLALNSASDTRQTEAEQQEDDSAGQNLGPLTDSRIMIQAVQDSFVQVQNPGRLMFLERVLRKGDIYYVPNEAGLSLSTSNAGGLVLTVDGVQLSFLGQSAEIMQNVALEPSILLKGHTSSD